MRARIRRAGMRSVQNSPSPGVAMKNEEEGAERHGPFEVLPLFHIVGRDQDLDTQRLRVLAPQEALIGTMNHLWIQLSKPSIGRQKKWRQNVLRRPAKWRKVMWHHPIILKNKIQHMKKTPFMTDMKRPALWTLPSRRCRLQASVNLKAIHQGTHQLLLPQIILQDLGIQVARLLLLAQPIATLIQSVQFRGCPSRQTAKVATAYIQEMRVITLKPQQGRQFLQVILAQILNCLDHRILQLVAVDQGVELAEVGGHRLLVLVVEAMMMILKMTLKMNPTTYVSRTMMNMKVRAGVDGIPTLGLLSRLQMLIKGGIIQGINRSSHS